jgi:hypothetical protein
LRYAVAVEDETRVHGLLRRLAALFDASSVSFDRMRKEVRVRSHVESRSVVFVAAAVEAWPCRRPDVLMGRSRWAVWPMSLAVC